MSDTPTYSDDGEPEKTAELLFLLLLEVFVFANTPGLNLFAFSNLTYFLRNLICFALFLCLPDDVNAIALRSVLDTVDDAVLDDAVADTEAAAETGAETDAATATSAAYVSNADVQ
jgi:hypothetical protein